MSQASKKIDQHEDQQFTDEQLLRRYQRNDPGAFDELVVRYYKRMVRVAFGYLKNMQMAEDVAQEAFIKVMRHAQQFQGQSSFSTWLYRITVNLSIDFIRKNKRTPLEYKMSTDGPQKEPGHSDEGGFLPRSVSTDPMEKIGRSELAEKLMDALETLPEKHRTIIILREIEGCSYDEIATILKIRKGTVMSRLFHARKTMQEKLSPILEDL